MHICLYTRIFLFLVFLNVLIMFAFIRMHDREWKMVCVLYFTLFTIMKPQTPYWFSSSGLAIIIISLLEIDVQITPGL